VCECCLPIGHPLGMLSASKCRAHSAQKWTCLLANNTFYIRRIELLLYLSSLIRLQNIGKHLMRAKKSRLYAWKQRMRSWITSQPIFKSGILNL
jgi:hypothetical protein